jgi:ribonuclease HI
VPWVRALLRGQKVYARADATGALQAEGGKVEIRYKPHDGRRYDARAANLSGVEGPPLPDETCGPAEEVKKAEAGASKGPGNQAASRSAKPGSRPRALGLTGPLPEGAVIVYADGAGSGNPGPAGLGVVVIDGDLRVEISEFLGEGTNNIAELTAVLRALEEVADVARPLVIHTDSQYTIGVVEKGWKAKANVELVQSLRAALADRQATRLKYVPGHSGVILNERADELAREAVKERRTRRTVIPKTGRPQ